MGRDRVPAGPQQCRRDALPSALRRTRDSIGLWQHGLDLARSHQVVELIRRHTGAQGLCAPEGAELGARNPAAYG